ncbi:uncharacterized protein ALTATR162_LOCUS8285 [Alternaria atra]|uniref:amidase n=1 Tax=Alternaria atra TaxID=119953 RepID=A0A8J2N2H9_9PLEO|nr:uncharacterized protein ALTATR162_LOCUS8285 [Alternaria atra]CAG5176048.1 unnamed protein product [Alternaria atra]
MAITAWESKVAAKQQAGRDKIPKEWLLPASVMNLLRVPLPEHPNRIIEMDIPRQSGILSEKELNITEKYTVEELLEQLRKGVLSSLEVTIAFSKRAAMAQQLLSCLTETYFPEAQDRARFLDSERAAGRLVGPLHGLPISVKDGFQIAGTAATIGFVSFLDHALSEKNSPLVEILLELGAVVYVKTNIPQTLMTADSHNNIFGRTLNPHNTALTAGGSSGGEGALIAFRGSPLGIGTDIAGSIRIPSLCCGTYGFKPSTARIPFGGQPSPVRDGMSFFEPSAGPLANDIQALRILCRALEAKGHQVVPISPLRAQVSNALALGFAYFGLDEPPAHIAASGEPLVPSVIQAMQTFGSFKCDFLADCEGLQGIPRVAALNVKRESIADEWRKVWRDERLDAVIGPAAQNTAVAHDTYGLPPYTLLLNVLDYPACIIPFGKASSALDAEHFTMGSDQVGPSCTVERYSLLLVTSHHHYQFTFLLPLRNLEQHSNMGSTSIAMRPWISVESWGPDRLDVVGIGMDDQMYRKRFDRGDGGWKPSVDAAWEPLSGKFKQIPAAISWSFGRLDIFGIGLNNQMYYKAWGNNRKTGGSWIVSDWQSIEGGFKSPPVPVSWGNGRIDLFGIGMDDQMYRKVYGGQWSPGGWEPLTGKFKSPPAAVSWGSDRLDVFGIGLDDQMYHRAWESKAWTTSSWTPMTGKFKSQPIVVSWGQGRLDVFGIGMDDQMYHKAYNGTNWVTKEWKGINGKFKSVPSAVSWGQGRIDVFGIGLDDQMYHKAYDNGGWVGDWKGIGGKFKSAPAAVSWGKGRIDVFGIGMDDGVWQQYYSNNAWASKWGGLGGKFKTF